ncbi:hypothetical protein [Listeria cornellensis]|uniref:Polysaccharide biosynthesis protein n=1 Tax=Listeria cornellensis FSL F6-0969 TaxID=1265820 RepID=W7BXI1_9LIST|nr:hypothetical protein [Listeria cornellensis]EUJ31579.1 hypothetical protein PCORN_04542 [Listeria cornellensis FSL F6-0969]
MSFTARMFNNAFFLTFVKKGFVVLNGIISLMLVARYFGPAMRGEYMFIVNVVIVGTTILNLGISLIYPHFRKQDKRAKNLFVSYSFLQFFSVFAHFFADSDFHEECDFRYQCVAD